MKFAGLLCFLFLISCKSAVPSEAITDNARKSVAEARTAIKAVEQSITPDCRTDEFSARLDGLSVQITNLGGMIESVELACKTEKQVLQEKLITRNVIISALLFLIALWLIVKIRLK